MTNDAEADPGDPASTDALDAAELKRKARFGGVMLALRTVLVQLVVLGGNVSLYRLLEPRDFGAFAIVQFALAFFAYFGDAGLGAALIQQKKPPTDIELSSVWFLQLGVSTVVAGTVGLGAPYILRFWPELGADAAWLLQALSVTLLLTALRVIPAILMERDLQFGRLAILDVLLNVGFYVTAVALAVTGLRVEALLGAVLMQGALGVLGVFLMRPWRPRLVFRWEAIRQQVRFGIFLQGKNVLGFAAGAVLPSYGGRVLGQHAVGLLSWAQSTAFFPLQIVAIISRITFPLYSRMQGHRELLRDTLEKSLQLTTMATLVFVGVFLGLAPNIIDVVFTTKWLPALPLFYIYTLGISIGFFTPLLATVFDGMGRPKLTLKLAAMATGLVWTLAPLGAYFYAELGFAAGYATVIWIGNIVMIVVVKRELPEVQLWRRTRSSILGAALAATVGVFFVRPWANGVVTLVLGTLLLVVVFLVPTALLERRDVREAIDVMRGGTRGVSP
ncbi:MAG: hypothetical protein EXR75_12210 [Myxococcales bacterium]|nr:hypothetical protein [Myxococcales bacterium]